MYNTSEEMNKCVNSEMYRLITGRTEHIVFSRAQIDAFNYEKILSILSPGTEGVISPRGNV